MQKNTITILNGSISLKQPEHGFRTSIDAVLLAAACPCQENQKIADFGCGVGSASIAAIARVPNIQLCGFEMQENHIPIARENAKNNGFEQNANFHHQDITNLPEEYAHNFDHIICNPPYEDHGKHITSPKDEKAKAIGHSQDSVDIASWVKAAFFALKSGGGLTIIHKADQLQTIMIALGKSFGATEIIPLWPKAGKPAKRVIIRTIKHRKSPANILPGLVLHNENGQYTDEAEKILRNKSGLFL